MNRSRIAETYDKDDTQVCSLQMSLFPFVKIPSLENILEVKIFIFQHIYHLLVTYWLLIKSFLSSISGNCLDTVEQR